MSFSNNNEDKQNIELESIPDTEAVEEVIEESILITEDVKETAEVIDTPDEKKKAKKATKIARNRNLRRLRYGTTSTAVTAIVIAAVVLLNVIVGIVADKYPISLDLSADKIYTLSEESVKIAEAIDKDLEIVVFAAESEFSNPTMGAQNSLPEFDTAMKEFYSALHQYKSHSKDKLTYSFIDPNQEPAKFAAYNDYEVANGDILFLCGERYKTCTINDLYELDTSNYSTTYTYGFESKVEKTLASNVYSLLGNGEQIVQVLVGHEEDANTVSGLKDLYELNGYAFEEISITGSAEFNKDATVMLIPAPAKDYSDEEIKRVQQWVYNNGDYGHHLMVYVNATADCPNLYEFLNVEYEIQVKDELILESDLNRLQNYNITFPMCDVPQTDYTANAVNTGKVFTPQARRLTTTLGGKSEEDLAIETYSVQLTSYPESAQLITLQDLEGGDSESIFNAKDDEYPLSSMLMTVIDSFNNNTQKSVNGTVTVSGCPAMAYGDFIKNGTYYNEDLLLDVANSITGNETSITISNKVLTSDTINFSEGTALWLGLGVFTIGLPLIVLIICLIVFLRRKNL